jgi:predicted lipid-binding transport protein (Tim44 family)
MVNVTSNSSPSTDTTTTTTRTTTTNSPTPGLETGADGSGSGGGDGGLSASQKGGIAGGIVGAVAVTSIIFLLFLLLRRRRKQQQHGQEQPVVEESEGRRSDYTGEGKGTERETSGHNVGGGENEIGVAMLASREKAELDASGRALHEMESPTVTKNIKEIGGYRELDGTPLAIAELAVPETGPEHGQNGQKGKTGHEQAP